MTILMPIVISVIDIFRIGIIMTGSDVTRLDFMVNEVFRSIQGEGICQGQSTVFIRFTGCNLRCSWCDTAYAYDEGCSVSGGELKARVQEYHDRNVCLTGGEPLLQEHLPKLTSFLLDDGYCIILETNGSLDISGFLDTISRYGHPPDWRRKLIISLDVKTPSSGESDSFQMDNLTIIEPWDQLKFVVNDENDIDYAHSFVDKNEIRSPVIIQPCDGTKHEDMARLFLGTDWPLQLDIRFTVQLHKVIWGIYNRGV